MFAPLAKAAAEQHPELARICTTGLRAYVQGLWTCVIDSSQGGRRAEAQQIATKSPPQASKESGSTANSDKIPSPS